MVENNEILMMLNDIKVEIKSIKRILNEKRIDPSVEADRKRMEREFHSFFLASGISQSYRKTILRIVRDEYWKDKLKS